MQALTAPPRSHLTAQQVTDLLQAPNLEVDFGAELLAADLTFVEDISVDLAGGSIERNMNATIHGTCRLVLSRALTWGVDLVKPYMVLSVPGPVVVTQSGGGYNSGTYDDGSYNGSGDAVEVRTVSRIEARWNLGVYALTTPDRRIGETPETYDVQGYDRLMLLNRQVGADYTVTAGTTYRQALLDAFAASGLTGVNIEGSAADDTLPKDKAWPLVAEDESDPDQESTPATFLRVVNDLLRAINFRAVWVDQDGVFRCESYRDPATRAVEWIFDADDVATIVGEDRTLSEDVWGTPNRWVFRQTNRPTGAPAPTEGDGIYTVLNQSDGPTSIDQRGLTWTSVIDYEAASQAKLVSLGDRRVAADRQVTSVIEATTGPFPGAGHADVFSYADDAIGDRKVQAVSWSFDLDGGDVKWRWERVA